MLCSISREGQYCALATKNSCTYNSNGCKEIIEKCSGCNRTLEVNGIHYCNVSPDPLSKWRVGNCNMATHIKAKQVKVVKSNPLKASRRAAKRG